MLRNLIELTEKEYSECSPLAECTCYSTDTQTPNIVNPPPQTNTLDTTSNSPSKIGPLDTTSSLDIIIPPLVTPTAPIRNHDPRIFAKIVIKGQQFDMLLDSGAACSWMGPKPAELLKDSIQNSDSYMMMPNGELVRDRGLVKLLIDIDNRQTECIFKVSDALQYELIMGIDLLNKLKITCDHAKQTWSTPSEIPHSFYDNNNNNPITFSALCTLNGILLPDTEQKTQIEKLVESILPPPDTPLTAAKITPHVIDVQNNRPIKQRARKIAPKVLALVHEEIDKLLKADIIENSMSPWSSCPVPVLKANGKLRLCIDYREVNNVTKWL